MKKLKAGIDIDDVYLDFMSKLCTYYNRSYGTKYQRSDFASFNLHETWGCTQAEATKRIHDFYYSEDHKEIGLVSGALEALTVLSPEYDLLAITARPEIVTELTMVLFNKHSPGLFSEYHFIGHHQSKGELCKKRGVHFMVDDALHNAKTVGENGIPVFLLDAPWNQLALPPNTTRFYHWSEVPDLARQLPKK